jgi:hypothetical protein
VLLAGLCVDEKGRPYASVYDEDRKGCRVLDCRSVDVLSAVGTVLFEENLIGKVKFVYVSFVHRSISLQWIQLWNACDVKLLQNVNDRSSVQYHLTLSNHSVIGIAEDSDYEYSDGVTFTELSLLDTLHDKDTISLFFLWLGVKCDLLQTSVP